jgi:AcrR family transcriptional regulator
MQTQDSEASSFIASKTEHPSPRRMSPEKRERQIVNQAIAFFAKHGFEGQLRTLTEDLGITHTLLYHYFPTKADLIERVYQEVVVDRWKPEWQILLSDEDKSAEMKFVEFYIDYAKTILTHDFVRILIFSGLSDKIFSDRFFKLLQTQILPLLISETRKYCEFNHHRDTSEKEMELLLGLHGGIFYLGVRRWIYGASFQAETYHMSDEEIIQDRVASYLLSAKHLLQKEKQHE